MVLTGQAKTDYQREYMRRRRAKIIENRSNIRLVRPAPVRPESVRPVTPETIRPKLIRPAGIGESQWAYIQMKAEKGNL